MSKSRSVSTSSSRETPVETGKEGDSGKPSAGAKTHVGVKMPSKAAIGGRPVDSGKPIVFEDTTNLHFKPLESAKEVASGLDVFEKGSASRELKASVKGKQSIYHDDGFSHFEPFGAKPIEEEEEEEEDDEPLPKPKGIE